MTTTINRYRNPWYKDLNRLPPPFYENSARKVLTYRGVEVFKTQERGYDFVLNGCCITQRAGVTEAKREIDKLLDGEMPCHHEVAKHLRECGHKPMSYDEYSEAYAKGERE